MSFETTSGAVRGTPLRRRGSIRRTITIDGHRPDGIDGPILLSGLGRDLITADDGTATTLAAGRFSLALTSEAGYEIASLVTAPAFDGVDTLIGTSARHGLRGRIRALDDPGERSARLVVAMLDDIPISAGLTRLARLHADAREVRVGVGIGPKPEPAATGHNLDICAGWVADSVMRVAVESGLPALLHDGVPAPVVVDPDDPEGWHELPVVPPDGYRRWRRVDIGPPSASGTSELHSFFRDSYFDADGAEMIEHEYTVTATVDRASAVVLRCDADARVLPSSDCPNAVPSAGALVGHALDRAGWIARRELVGAHACTHLSDTLVNLANVHDLLADL